VIRGILPIRYPQSVLALQPDAIVRQLEKQAPIAKATVTRRLFPSIVMIQIEERHPVATVYAGSESVVTLPQRGIDTLFPMALLDQGGTWMPYDQYIAFNPSVKLPDLRVLGMQDQYRSQWSELYQVVSRSPVKISVIDWRDAGNLILQTEIGIVHCGAFDSSQFAKQLRVLDQMRKLSDNVAADKVAYIDLTNPDRPMLQLVNGAVTKSPSP
jgi:cell division protein FtsQ